MNHEQNNLNSKKFSTLDNNLMHNNQGIDFNPQSINIQDKQKTSSQQPIMQESIQRSTNIFNNGSASNQNFNSASPKKHKLVLIIGIIVSVIIIACTIIIVGTNFTVDKQSDLSGNQAENKDKLKIGDYIEYEPDSVESYTKLNYSIASRDNGVIPQEVLTWRVLRIYDDGSIELIGSQTKSRLFLQGHLGYNNGVFLMNDICANLYSKKSENIVARSVNIADVEYLLTEKGRENRDTYHEFKYKYGENWTFTSNETMYYPNLYQYELNAGMNTINYGSDGITASESYDGYSNGVTTEKAVEMKSGMLTGKETFYALNMQESNFGEGFNVLNTNGDSAYWVASRWTNYSSSKVSFGLYVINSKYFKGATMAYSSGTYGDMTFNYSLRPVVKLDKDVKIEISSGENSKSNPHKITMY